MLGTTVFLQDVYYYDEEARVIKSLKEHYLGGVRNAANYDEVTNSYSFIGELKTSIRVHRANGATTTILTRNEYDHMGRLVNTYEKINTQDEVLLVANTYNEIGQLQQKRLHDGLQATVYTYNERGWLKSNISDQFSESLDYQESSSPQWNGNISAQHWGSNGVLTFPNKFAYSYDALNRLTSASSTGIVMSESIDYDAMGNISHLSRNSGTAGTYNYDGNRLNSITAGPLATGSYTYDVNGNVKIDGRTGVTVDYNYLNLPSSMSKTGLSISYIYSATGEKLRKISSTGGTTDYIDGIQYQNNVLEFIQTAKGIARNNAGIYSYEYDLTDHLGNVRYSFKKDAGNGTVQRLQEVNYYAFGLKNVVFAGPNKYLYNGKELQEELEDYDYGARFYDPVIGRWNVVDPMTSIIPSYTPYNYCYNNPINSTDPNGMLATYNWSTGEYMDRGQVVSWSTVQQQIAEGKFGATYHFSSGNRSTSFISAEEKGNKNNEFFYDGKKFRANSLQTLRGRDDGDNRIGAFNSIITLGENDLITILGHASYIMFDEYMNNIERAVMVESVGGKLDYKNSAYDLLGINPQALLQINGNVYNANEAGNLLWGMVLEYTSTLFDPNWLAEAGTKGRNDEPWEQRAISIGRALGRKLTNSSAGFKNKVLEERLQNRQ